MGQEDRETITRKAARETIGSHQRATDRDTTAGDHAIAVGEAGEIVDEVQAIDVAVQHRHHGARRRVALPRVDAVLESVPRQQAGERVDILCRAAREQSRETTQSTHGEFVEAGLVGAIENDERPGGSAAGNQRNGDELARDVTAAR